jgi:hypothetical protein
MGTKASVYDYSPSEAIAIAAKTNGTVNSSDINRTLYEGLDFWLVCRTLTDGTHTLKIQEADDNGAGAPGTYADVAGNQLVLPASAAGVNGVLAVAATIKRVGYGANKKWVRAVITTAGATTGAIVGVIAFLHDARGNPVANP